MSLKSRELIAGDSLTWSITDKGIKYLFENYEKFSNRDRIWREVPHYQKSQLQCWGQDWNLTINMYPAKNYWTKI